MKMDSEKKLYFGIPKGSLNRPEPNRGDTKLLLEKAGWKLEGYDHRHEQFIPNIIEGDKEVKFVASKPRNFPLFLCGNELDLAIYGRDIQEEFCSGIYQMSDWSIGGKKRTKEYKKHLKRWPKSSGRLTKKIGIPEETRKGFEALIKESENKDSEICQSKIFPNQLCDLGYGKVDICFALQRDEKNNVHFPLKNSDEPNYEDFPEPLKNFLYDKASLYGTLNCVTEYPNLTYREFCKFVPPGSIKNTFASIVCLDSFFGPDFLGDLIFELRKDITSKKIQRELKRKESKEYTFKWKIPKINIIRASSIEPLINTSHIILDCVASGESLKRTGLEKFGKPIIKDSTARLYAPPLGIFYPHTPSIAQHYNLKSPFGERDHEVKPEDYDDDSIKDWRNKKIDEVAEKLEDAAKSLGWID